MIEKKIIKVKISKESFKIKEKLDFIDKVASEDPLEIYVNRRLYSTTMRYPDREGDLNFAIGYCFTEGIIKNISDIKKISFCPENKNRVLIDLTDNRIESLKKTGFYFNGNFMVSGCGICGKKDIYGILERIDRVGNEIKINIDSLYKMKEIYETKQYIFNLTGAVHSCGIFDKKNKLLSFAEDIGRHNALDKAIGLVLKKGNKKPFIIFLSSRVSYEMIVKSARIGAEIVIAVSSVTLKAIEIAERFNITLIGFFRDYEFNIYTDTNRIII
jgi:FdhD protein